MAITIKKVSTKRELKKFIRFNYELYKENPYSVPDLYDDMLNTFNKKKNAAFEFCEAEYFLAYKDGKIVGRIAGIINHRANATWNKKDVRFGWIDFIDDLEVSSRLLQTVEEWGKSKGMENIQGPLGFTDFDAEGMLIEGFDQLSTMQPSTIIPTIRNTWRNWDLRKMPTGWNTKFIFLTPSLRSTSAYPILFSVNITSR